MASRTWSCFVIAALILRAGTVNSADLKYLNNNDLNRELRELARAHRQFIHVETLATTPGKEEVRFLELGSGSVEQRKARPAVLVVAGIEGNDLAGPVSALFWARQLGESYRTNETVKDLLDSTTIFVMPRLNPDAAKIYFEKPRREAATAPFPKVDDDHDGLLDEDDTDDLNGDGLITSMRVEDPEGEFIIDRSEPRLMLKADRSKGEKGQWRVLSEGRDDDHDDAWNEDGVGGVNYNRNFPYNYRFFAPWAGIHQMSETVTRALAEFIVDHQSIAVVFTFGAADNLTQTPKGDAPKRPPTALHEEDVPVYRELGKSWRDALGLKKELGGASEPGTFSDWIYFHRGRLSLAARPWSPALQLELAKGKKDDKAKDEKPKEDKPKDEKPRDDKAKEEKPEDKKPEPDSRNEEERKFLKWLDEESPGGFVPWEKFDHPDFPGKTVEIGGFAPFAKSNPPEKLLVPLAEKHARFLTEMARKLPRIQFRKTTAKHLGNGVFEVVVQVENTGFLPTTLAQGEVTREVTPLRLVCDIDQKQILSGVRSTPLGPIAGSGGMRETRYIILAPDLTELKFEAISALGGTVKTNITLERGE